MRVIARHSLITFAQRYPDTWEFLYNWYSKVTQAKWIGPTDVLDFEGEVNFTHNASAVFYLKAIPYCIVAKINYDFATIIVTFVGSVDDLSQVLE